MDWDSSDKFSWELAQSHKERVACDLLAQKPSLLTAPASHFGPCTFRLPETRQNILTGHKAKLSGHRTRWKENSSGFYMGDPQRSSCEQMPVGGEP